MPQRWTEARARLDRALNPRRADLPTHVSQPSVPMEAPDGKSEDLRSKLATRISWLRQYGAILSCAGFFVIFCSPSRPAVHLKLHPAESAEQQLLRAAERRARLAETQAAEAAEELRQLRERFSNASVPSVPTSAANDRLDCTTDEKVRSEEANATITTYGREFGNRKRLGAICRNLAPAVALRPAPIPNALSPTLAVKLSPWVWAQSPAKLNFNPDGYAGLLATPWGDGRWGSLPRHPNVLWATFAGRTHLLLVRGCSLVSHRCADNQTNLVHTSQRLSFDLASARQAASASDASDEDLHEEDDADEEEEEDVEDDDDDDEARTRIPKQGQVGAR